MPVNVTLKSYLYFKLLPSLCAKHPQKFQVQIDPEQTHFGAIVSNTKHIPLYSLYKVL